MKSFNEHPNVIRIETFVEDSIVLYIFMQFADGGDLLREVMKVKKIPEVDFPDLGDWGFAGRIQEIFKLLQMDLYIILVLK